eukprot:814153-Amorphochlora_amoeboformis.AAC.1
MGLGGRDRIRARSRARIRLGLIGVRVRVRVRIREELGLGSDYSECRSPRTIDSSTVWGYIAVRDNSSREE